MQLALWDRPPAACLKQAATDQDILVECRSAERCVALLMDQQVDAALLPTTVALSNAEEWVILPAAAVSSWSYPFARLKLRTSPDRLRSVACPQGALQEALIARIILKEHYGVNPAFLSPAQACSANAVADATLEVDGHAMRVQSDGTVLDLGVEWYELAQYPMVWGLFVTLPCAATEQMNALLETLARSAESLADGWPEQREFHADSLRLRLDDLAVASLTRLAEFLFFYRVTDELVVPRMLEVEEPEVRVPWWARPQAVAPR